MKIAIVTYFDEQQSAVGELTRPNKQEYAKRHGYELIIHREPLVTDRSSGWNKDASVMKALPHFDAVYWTDADSVFMDMSRKLEPFLDDEIDFVSGGINDMNNGNFLIRNTPDAMRFMRDVWEFPQKNADFAWLLAPDSKKWSQLCMDTLLTRDLVHIRYRNVGHDMCMHYWMSGNGFMYHPCGARMDRRFEYLHEFLNPSTTFAPDAADLHFVNWMRLRTRKGHVLEFARGDGNNGVARKLIRIGWRSTLIGDQESLLKSFGGFGSCDVQSAVPAGNRFNVVSIQRHVPVEIIEPCCEFAEFLVHPVGMIDPVPGFEPFFVVANTIIFRKK